MFSCIARAWNATAKSGSFETTSLRSDERECRELCFPAFAPQERRKNGARCFCGWSGAGSFQLQLAEASHDAPDDDSLGMNEEGAGMDLGRPLGRPGGRIGGPHVPVCRLPRPLKRASGRRGADERRMNPQSAFY